MRTSRRPLGPAFESPPLTVTIRVDSGIALKSGMCQAGADFNMPTVNVRIEHVSARSRSSCFVTGSEDEGGVHNVSVKDYVRTGQGFAALGDD